MQLGIVWKGLSKRGRGLICDNTNLKLYVIVRSEEQRDRVSSYTAAIDSAMNSRLEDVICRIDEFTVAYHDNDQLTRPTSELVSEAAIVEVSKHSTDDESDTILQDQCTRNRWCIDPLLLVVQHLQRLNSGFLP